MRRAAALAIAVCFIGGAAFGAMPGSAGFQPANAARPEAAPPGAAGKMPELPGDFQPANAARPEAAPPSAAGKMPALPGDFQPANAARPEAAPPGQPPPIAPCAPAVQTAGPYGVCAHLHRVKDPAERADECRRIAAAGIRRVRFDLEWWRVQKTPGAPLDFAHYDAVIADAEAAGLTVLPILFDIPKWAEPVWEHLDAWSNFVSGVVSRYGERFPDIEIWNEENLRHFWKHEPNPALYAKVLKVACTEAKAANPRVRVLFGGTAGVPLDFIRKAYENGAASSFDALCVHPYCHPRQPEGSLDAQLEALRALMAEFGDAEKPVVITELGWPTHDARLGDVGVVQAGLRVARPEQTSWRAAYAATEAGAEIHAELLQEALPPGSTCEACSGARLRERLAAGDVDVVIYPFDETFPIDTFPEVLAFVRRGGVLVDVGGMPLWFGVREPSPGVFVRIEDKTGEATAPMRRELRIAEAANWTDPTLPREANRAFPTAAAVAAGFKGDPAGEFATRYQTPALLREGDEFVPLLVAKDSEGRDVASASVTRLAGGGIVIVSGSKKSGAAGSAGEGGQARFLVRAMAMAFAEGVEQYFWYEFRGREIDPHYSEHHFGLTHRDFSPKPAHGACSTFIAMRPAGSVQAPGPWRDEERRLFFPQWTRPDGTKAGVVWKIGEPQRMKLRFTDAATLDGPPGCRPLPEAGAGCGDDASSSLPGIRFFDIFGNPVLPDDADDDGNCTLTVSESPIFFSGGNLAAAE